MIIGGWHRINGVTEGRCLSDIEALSRDEDDINCDPTDLPYKVYDHASIYTPIFQGVVTCGGRNKIWNTLSKCILQRKGNDSNNFPDLNLKRSGLSLTAISNKIFAIGGWPNSKTMETINLNTDKQWKKDELPFSVSEHCSIGLGNNIIVTGGLDENLNVSTIMRFLCKKQ